jgi:DNA gyrase subunit A
MNFKKGDELLSLSVIPAGLAEDDTYIFTVTDGGYAKRSKVSEYRMQGRGGLGIKAMKLNDDRGKLVGGLVVIDTDEVMAIRESGQITRSPIAEVPVKGRDTMGVKFVDVAGSDAVKAIAINPEKNEPEAPLQQDTSIDEPVDKGEESDLN